MIIICTGQSGLNKKAYLTKVVKLASNEKKKIKIFNVSDYMYEISKCKKGHILEKEKNDLDLLAQQAFKEIGRDIEKEKDKKSIYIINVHATFRWKRGLFPGMTYNMIKHLSPDCFITLLDDVQNVTYRLHLKDKKYKFKHSPFTLKDVMVWREEEILAASLLADACNKPHFLVAQGHNPEVLLRLMFYLKTPKVYASFPITNVKNNKKVLLQIKKFRTSLSKKYIVFDPLTIRERELLLKFNGNQKSIKIPINGKTMTIKKKEIDLIREDIDDQIISRDLALIDQSDAVVAFIASDKVGNPIASFGCNREMIYAKQRGKQVYAIWTPKKKPGPFEVETTNEIFYSIEDALNKLDHVL